MTIINNIKLAKYKTSQDIDSLFTDKTFKGYYKKLKNRVLVYDFQANLIGAAIKNKYNEILLIGATKTDQGIWYNYATQELEKLFHIENFSQHNEIAKQLLNIEGI